MHAVTFSRAFEIAALPSPDPGEIFSDSGGTRELEERERLKTQKHVSDRVVKMAGYF